MKTLIHVLTALAALTVFSPLSEVTAAEPAELEVDIPPNAVVGFPLFVSVKLRGPAEIPQPKFWSDANSFDIHLKSDRESVLFPVSKSRTYTLSKPRRYTVMIDGKRHEEVVTSIDAPLPKWRIGHGETISVVLDLSNLDCQWQSRIFKLAVYPKLPESDYELTVAFSEAQVRYINRIVHLIPPNEKEQKFLDRLRAWRGQKNADQRDFTNPWATFIVKYPELKEDIDSLSEAAASQLSFYRIVAELVHAPKPIPDLNIPAQAAGIMAGRLQTEVRLLEFEIAKARGEEEAAIVLRAQILEEAPFYQEVLDQIDHEGGLIRRFRGLQ